MFDYNALLNEMNRHTDESYRQFTQKLLPGTDGILGIRLPQLRKIAKQIPHHEMESYFSQVKYESFEETMLMGFVIGEMSTRYFPLKQIMNQIKEFLIHISNWSVCDSFCASLKIAKKEQEAMFDFLLEVYELSMKGSHDSSKDFSLRFVIVMWLDYYLNDTYIPIILEKLRRISSQAYYVNMAIAWCQSAIYTKNDSLITNMLEGNFIQKNCMNQNEIFVHNKTIQKICESLKVDTIKKENIKKLRLSSNV